MNGTIDPRQATGIAIITLDESGQNSITLALLCVTSRLLY